LNKQEFTLSEKKGVWLNPTLSFLDLKFDILPMLASKSEVIERDHILCVFKSLAHEINHLEITSDYLEVLQKIEGQEEIPSKDQGVLKEVINLGLVFRV